MKRIYKLFTVGQYEEQEEWINKMASIGWNLVNIGVFKHDFEQGNPGEYVYRIEMGDPFIFSEERSERIKDIEESGAEIISVNGRWICCRRRAELGDFVILSKEAHKEQRMNVLRYILLFIIVNLFLGKMNHEIYLENIDKPILNYVAWISCMIVAGICAIVTLPLLKRIIEDK